jgi:hypothetical protein
VTTEPRDGGPAHIPTDGVDDDDRWMARIQQLEDHEVDALLAGDAPSDRALAPISDVARALRTRVTWEPVPALGQPLRDQLAAGLPPAGRRAARRALLVAAAAVLVASVAAISVGAAQNRLPADLQDAVASTADLVGVHVPTSDERSDDAGEARSDIGADHGRDDEAPVAAAAGADGDPGYEGVTPGGATPADPGTVGDSEPAIPAVPPDEQGPDAVPASAGGPAAAIPEDPGGQAGTESDDQAGEDQQGGASQAPERAPTTSRPVVPSGR